MTGKRCDEEFTRLVRNRRRQLKMSQLELAVQAGVNPSIVSYVEGAGGCTIRNAVPIARVLGINLMSLVEEED